MKFKVGELTKWTGQMIHSGHWKEEFEQHLKNLADIEDIVPNTFGIILECFESKDVFENVNWIKDKNNAYIWFSQIDQKSYLIYEDEIDYA